MERKAKDVWTWIVTAAVIALPFHMVCWALIVRSGDFVCLTDNYSYWTSPDGVILEWYPPSENKSELYHKLRDRGQRPPRVGPDVDGYRVYQRVIVGHVAKTWEGEKRPAWLRQDDVRIPGYFIIDLRRDTLQKGLSKQEWLEKLRSYGIKREPELFKPAWYDEILRRNRVCEE